MHSIANETQSVLFRKSKRPAKYRVRLTSCQSPNIPPSTSESEALGSTGIIQCPILPRIAKADIHVMRRRIALPGALAEVLHIELANRREQTYVGPTTSRYKKVQVTVNLSRTSLPQFHTSPKKPNTSFVFNSNHQILSKMRLFLQGTAVLALLVSNASAVKSGVFAANGVELELYQSGEDFIYGEPVSTSSLEPSYTR